jgi:hypothetical protein
MRWWFVWLYPAPGSPAGTSPQPIGPFDADGPTATSEFQALATAPTVAGAELYAWSAAASVWQRQAQSGTLP